MYIYTNLAWPRLWFCSSKKIHRFSAENFELRQAAGFTLDSQTRTLSTPLHLAVQSAHLEATTKTTEGEGPGSATWVYLGKMVISPGKIVISWDFIGVYIYMGFMGCHWIPFSHQKPWLIMVRLVESPYIYIFDGPIPYLILIRYIYIHT